MQRVSILLPILILMCGTTLAEETRLLRYPDIHEDFVVFVHAGDIWRVPADGGTARRLTSHDGVELTPRISPDGSLVAYSAEYAGSRQVYVMPAGGGEPRQLTFYTDVGTMPPRGGFDYWIQDWTSDGRILVRMNRTPWGRRMGRYYLVDPDGGLETPLPVLHGGSADLDPDGRRLAYTPIDREFRTWKRTRGGRAQDIWIYDLDRNRSERVTTHDGDDNFPMWVDDELYFTSDRDGRMNLYVHEALGEARAITEHDESDVLWPATGPGAIVYMHDGGLRRLDVASGDSVAIPIRIAGDLPATVPYFRTVEDRIDGADISPSGARAVFAARGDLFTVPAEHGPTRNLTRSQGVRERDAAWSPDGRWIAYLSDETGSYQLYVRAQDGTGGPRRLTDDLTSWPFAPAWSPDSKALAFGSRDRILRILDVESGDLAEVDRGTLESIRSFAWSPDSRWLAYVRSRENRMAAIGLYSRDAGDTALIGDGMTNDRGPVFSEDGRYLYFLSDRDYNITFSDFEFNFLYDNATRIFVAVLDPEAATPFPPRSDEEAPKEEDGDEEEGNGKDGDEDREDEPLRIERDGIADRTLAVPGIAPGNYGAMVAAGGALFYVRTTDDGASLHRYDLAAREESKIADGIGTYALTPDGKKILYRFSGGWGIADAQPGLKAAESRLDLSRLRMKLDPRAEWRQIWADAVRITGEWFYDPAMHGMDWPALSAQYGAMVEDVAHRDDLDFLLGELVSELEAGHTYVGSGDAPRIDRVPGGMLGCEFEADDSGRYRIARIYRGENWDPAYRSPLTVPGSEVPEGAVLLAVDGVDLTTDDNPYRLLEGKANAPVRLTVADTPKADPRDVTVIALSGEGNLRYIDWVKSRMALVDRLSGGRVGYIHLPDTAFDGNRMLQKLFYAQANKPALIVDDRYNGGGFIPDRMMEYLARPRLAYWDRRDIGPMLTPGFAHTGPKAMLANGYSSSGGDALPYFFRKLGLGPIIGTRTWGGLIGLSGNPQFVDGGNLAIPTFRLYDERGEWVVENEGVAPDIEVFDLPEAFLDGGDPSIEKAVEVLLRELEVAPATMPAVPRPPDMSAP